MALGLLRLVSPAGPTAAQLCNVCRFQRSANCKLSTLHCKNTRMNSQPPGECVPHNTPTPITHVLIAPPPHRGAEVIKPVSRCMYRGVRWLVSVGILPLLFPPPPSLRGAFDPPLQLVRPPIHYFLFKTRRLFNLFQPIQGDRSVSLSLKASPGFHTTAQRICDG